MTNIPRIVICGLRGGSGKTVVSLGILSALREAGMKVIGFKKGPDYIDPGWLTLASGNPCRNLDMYLVERDKMVANFIMSSIDYDLVLIEGNRGLFDGLDEVGRFSTAELAKTLKAPCVLLVDVTMTTRTVAAMIKGCQVFEEGLDIKGIILNKVANLRQEALIRSAIRDTCHIPVIGAIPRLSNNPFPERHMGLVPNVENDKAVEAIEWAREMAKSYVDLGLIMDIGKAAPGLSPMHFYHESNTKTAPGPGVRIGVLRDKAFWFYYPENLELIKRLGAEIVEIDSIKSQRLPDVHGVYIGGGFPETQAHLIANNRSFRDHLLSLISKNLPVYAECGGLIFLGREVSFEGGSYPMLGIFPISFRFQKRPAGHGYTEFRALCPNPFYPLGKIFKGHEFHYSVPIVEQGAEIRYALEVKRGSGFSEGKDGLIQGPVFGTYMHVHGLGEDSWAKGLIDLAMAFKVSQRGPHEILGKKNC